MAHHSIIRYYSPDDSSTCHRLIQTLKQKLNNSSNNHSSGLVQIANKYFTARLDFLPLLAATKDTEGDDNSIMTTGLEEGLILAFDDRGGRNDDDRKASFDKLKEHLEKNELQDYYCVGETVRLCCAVTHFGTDTEHCSSSGTINGTKGSSSLTPTKEEEESEYSRRVLWCLDHGIEYVEDVDFTVLEDESTDKLGFPRIVEALSNAYWSTAAMKQKSSSNAAAVPSSCITNYYSNRDDKFESCGTSCEQQAPKEKTEKKENIDIHDIQEIGDNKFESIVSGADSSDQMDLLDQMESLMREAKDVSATARGGDLSDEQRRTRATETALKIAKLMEVLDGDDEEGDSEKIIK